jgi:hypothetical protein
VPDAEAAGELVVPGGPTGNDGAFQGQAVASAEGLKNVPDQAVRRLLYCGHGGNPSLRIVSPASGIFMLRPSGRDRQPG